MIKKYIINGNEYQIKTIIADRETFRFLFVGGKRFLKNTKKRLCFDSFKDAKSHLINKSSEDVGLAQNNLILACERQRDVLLLSDSD